MLGTANITEQAFRVIDYDSSGITSHSEPVGELAMGREFHFYGTWDDSWHMLRGILAEHSIEIVHNSWVRSPSEVFRRGKLDDELQSRLRQHPAFLIVPAGMQLQSSGFLVHPTGPRAGQYTLDPRTLGEALWCLLPACFERDGKINLANGKITLEKEYWISNRWQKPSESIQRLYGNIVESIKHTCVKHRLVRTTGWIGHGAVSLLEQGSAIVSDKGV